MRGIHVIKISFQHKEQNDKKKHFKLFLIIFWFFNLCHPINVVVEIVETFLFKDIWIELLKNIETSLLSSNIIIKPVQ